MVEPVRVQIVQTSDNGDGTYTVKGRTPSGEYVTLVVPLDKLKDGSVYEALWAAAIKVEAKRAGIAAHDESNTKG